jgi:hypothetical protein
VISDHLQGVSDHLKALSAHSPGDGQFILSRKTGPNQIHNANKKT